MATNRPFSLMDLPAEILYEICESLSDFGCDPTCETQEENPYEIPARLAALSALSRTCWTLRDIAQPILHQNFPLMTSVGRGYERIFQFARTLIERPDLAQKVRIVGLDYSLPARLSFGSRFYSMLPPSSNALATHYNLEHPNTRSDDARVMDFMRQLVLCLATEVQCVNIANLPSPNLAPGRDPANPDQELPNVDLKKLTRLRIKGESFYPFPRELAGREPSCLLTAANITTLEMTYTTDVKNFFHTPSLPPIQLEMINRLDFVFCCFSSFFLAAMAESCGNLRQLTYISGDGVTAHGLPPAEWVPPSFYNFNQGSITPCELSMVFTRIARGLRRLKVLVLEFPNED
ncbi:hypothetical protein B0T19DRAFT_467122 [Cercophora scortea]|uniref:F-box domain-containing protein n=1 Tax=Cercophora scortea TaxID=314031 RepID=A0AAE0I7G1_9PEZI|nr:hypothetical protein B0T19DRAFT_467122 [Cercophora scortea]